MSVHIRDGHKRAKIILAGVIIRGAMRQQAAQIASQVQTIERLTVENGKLEGEKSLLRQQLAAVQERQPNRVVRILRGVFGWRPALP